MPVAVTPPRSRAAAHTELLTLAEAATRLKVAPATLKKWALRKRIDFRKVGKFMRFTPEQIEQFIASQPLSKAECR